MAKVQTVLLDFAGSGQLARTLVYYDWRSIHCVRQYVIPSDARTPAQLAQRARLTAALSAFHQLAMSRILYNAWCNYVRILLMAMTGYNALLQALMQTMSLSNPVSFPWRFTPTPPNCITIQTKNLHDLTPGTETGTFVLNYGPDPSNLNSSQHLTHTAPGLIISSTIGFPGQIVHWQLTKTTARTGIVVVLLPT